MEQQVEFSSSLDLANPTNWVLVTEANRRYPSIFSSPYQADWDYRHAATNGLAAAMAVAKFGKRRALHVGRYLAVKAGVLLIDSQSRETNIRKSKDKKEPCAGAVHCREEAGG